MLIETRMIIIYSQKSDWGTEEKDYWWGVGRIRSDDNWNFIITTSAPFVKDFEKKFGKILVEYGRPHELDWDNA